jgi:hypothetical protein
VEEEADDGGTEDRHGQFDERGRGEREGDAADPDGTDRVALEVEEVPARSAGRGEEPREDRERGDERGEQSDGEGHDHPTRFEDDEPVSRTRFAADCPVRGRPDHGAAKGFPPTRPDSSTSMFCERSHAERAATVGAAIGGAAGSIGGPVGAGVGAGFGAATGYVAGSVRDRLEDGLKPF